MKVNLKRFTGKVVARSWTGFYTFVCECVFQPDHFDRRFSNGIRRLITCVLIGCSFFLECDDAVLRVLVKMSLHT